MYKRFLWIIPFAFLLAACGGDDTSIDMCNCEPDEYCVDSKCYSTNASIVPAPDEQ